MAYFQPMEVAETIHDYSELVPAGVTGTKAPAANNQMFQRPERYAFLSAGGEPLELDLTPGTIAW